MIPDRIDALIREMAHQERRRRASRLPRAAGSWLAPGAELGAAAPVRVGDLPDCGVARFPGALAALAAMVRR